MQVSNSYVSYQWSERRDVTGVRVDSLQQRRVVSATFQRQQHIDSLVTTRDVITRLGAAVIEAEKVL